MSCYQETARDHRKPWLVDKITISRILLAKRSRVDRQSWRLMSRDTDCRYNSRRITAASVWRAEESGWLVGERIIMDYCQYCQGPSHRHGE